MSNFEDQSHPRVKCHLPTEPNTAMFKEQCTFPEAIVEKEREIRMRKAMSRQQYGEHVLIDEGGISTAYETRPDPSNNHCFFNLASRQSSTHGFLQAAVTAFSEHYPLIIRPQHIWIMILQAVAEHVNRNPKELRAQWIATPAPGPAGPTPTNAAKQPAPASAGQSKIKLVVNRNDFVLGQTNDWASVVCPPATAGIESRSSFLGQIQQHTLQGVFEDTMIDEMLSGTTHAERVTMGITVMDTLQSYFEYIVRTLCGFPSIILEGNLEDWQLIRVKAEALLQNRCLPSFANDWSPALLSLLDKFVSEYVHASSTTNAQADEKFWNTMIKRGGVGGSGGYSWFNGWINILFPFLKENQDNPLARIPYEEVSFAIPAERSSADGGDEDDHRVEGGTNVNTYPQGMSSAPVKWQYLGRELPLDFKSGFICSKQDPVTKAIMPLVAWYITCDKKEIEKMK